LHEKLKSRTISLLKWLWIAAVLVAAVIYFARNFNNVETYFHLLKPGRVFLSLILMLAAKSLFALVSRFSVKAEGWNPSYIQMFSIYALTQLAKYLPGGVWHHVGRFGVYRSKEMTNAKAGKAMILENIWLVTSAFAVGFSTILLFEPAMAATILDQNIPFTLLRPAGVVVLAFWLPGMYLLQRFFTDDEQKNRPDPLTVSLSLSLAWILVGCSFYVLFPYDFRADLPMAIGGFAISWAVGFMAIFAPGGLGIREFILSFMFSSSLSPELAPVLATFHRLIWVTSEIILGLLFSLPIFNFPPVNNEPALDETRETYQE
jgi:hypothetical protein